MEWKTLIYRGKEYSTYEINNNGEIRNSANGFILKRRFAKPSQHKNRKGYYVSTITVNNKSIQVILHRALAETFIPNPNCCKFVLFKDGDL